MIKRDCRMKRELTWRAMGAGQASCASGFSLIELIVVVGIIALLAGMVIPTIGRVRENGKSTECVNNLRQIGQGFALYVDEHRGIFPGDGTAGGVGTEADIAQADAWYNVIPPYLQMDSYKTLSERGRVPCPGSGKSLFICPNSPKETALAMQYQAGEHSSFYCSYAMNYWVNVSERGIPTLTKRLRMTQIQAPSVFVILTESPDGLLAKVHPATMRHEDPSMTAFRHREKVNALFADWHVESIPAKRIWKSDMVVEDNLGGFQWNPERGVDNQPLKETED